MKSVILVTALSCVLCVGLSLSVNAKSPHRKNKLDGDCNYFPRLSKIGSPGSKTIASILNKVMCATTVLLNDLANKIRWLIEMVLGKHRVPVDKCSNPVNTPAAMYIGIKEKSVNGIALFDIDNTGNYVRRKGDVIKTKEIPSYFIANSAKDRIFTVEPAEDGNSNFTVYVRYPCTGEYSGRFSYNFGDVIQYLALDQSEKYVATAGVKLGTAKLIEISPDGSFKEIYSYAIPTNEGYDDTHGASHPTKVAFYSPQKNIFAVACANISQIKFYQIDITNAKKFKQFNYNLMLTNDYPVNFVFASNQTRMYVLALKTARVTYYESDPRFFGSFFWKSEMPIASTGETFKDGDEFGILVLHPSGKFLYAMHVNHQSIAMFLINQSDGFLSLIDYQAIDGINSYDMAITPDGGKMMVSFYGSDSVGVFTIDTNTGRLIEPKIITGVGSASTIWFS